MPASKIDKASASKYKTDESSGSQVSNKSKFLGKSNTQPATGCTQQEALGKEIGRSMYESELSRAELHEADQRVEGTPLLEKKKIDLHDSDETSWHVSDSYPGNSKCCISGDIGMYDGINSVRDGVSDMCEGSSAIPQNSDVNAPMRQTSTENSKLIKSDFPLGVCSVSISPKSATTAPTWAQDLKEIHAKLDELRNLMTLSFGAQSVARRHSTNVIQSPTYSTHANAFAKRQSRTKTLHTMPRTTTLNTLDSHSSDTSIQTVQTFKNVLARRPSRNSIRNWDRGDSSRGVSPTIASESSVKNSVVSAASQTIRDRIRATSSKLRDLRVEHSVRKRRSTSFFDSVQVSNVMAWIWNLLEEPESSRCAHWLSTLMPWFIISTVAVTLLQSAKIGFHGRRAAVWETSIDSLYLLELLLRFVSCPNHYSFLFNVYNYIDLAAAVPLIPRICAGFVLSEFEVIDSLTCFLFCVVPMIRLLKLLRRFEKFHLLLNAFKLAFEALPVLFFILAAIALLFSMLIFLVEPSDNIGSWPLAAWLTIVTMATVGYGETTPITPAGRIVTSVLIVVTVMYMAIPLGIVGNAFTETWKDRDRILLMQRTRDRLKQWGYTAHDIPTLFHLSDDNGDSKLTLDEFTRLIKQMQLGFSETRILELFSLFDKDGNGTVDDAEFVQTLFPYSYHEIYQSGDAGNSTVQHPLIS